MSTINYICSLGSLCHSACWIKNMNYKKCSYPFDWIFARIDIVIHCLENNFKLLLNKKYHIEHISKQKGRSGHKKYSEKLFNHHNILNEKNYNYFVRCVNRFHILLKKKEKKLFIIGFYNRLENMSKEDLNKLKKLYHLLNSLTINFEILVIYHIIGNKLKLNIDNSNKKFKLLEIITTKRSTGTRMSNENEDRFFNKSISKLYTFNILDDIH